MSDKELRKKTKGAISGASEVQDIYSFFKEMNYPEDKLLDSSYKRDVSEFSLKAEMEKKVNQIYTVLSFEDNLPVFLIKVDSLKNRTLKYVSKKFSDNYLRSLLIFTKDFDELVFVLPDFKKKEAGKIELKLIKLRLDPSDLYYSDIFALSKIYLDDSNKGWRRIWRQWQEAFDVKKVTEEFFEDYKNQFFNIRRTLKEEKDVSPKVAHEFTLQFLNRLMFTYFVEKKDWLKPSDDKSFIEWLWDKYREKQQFGDNVFHKEWLKTFFLEALNQKFSGPKENLPEEVNIALRDAPYLNGGLFRKNEIDEEEIELTDQQIKEVLGFFEKYNFTVKEDMPLEKEVAVDPQMIGYVYESLANVAEEIYDRNDLGIFYTPRNEVDFMVRRTLVGYLDKNTSLKKEDVIRFVFDKDKTKIRKKINEKYDWYEIEDALDNLQAVDPACGSGAFLVGLLNVITELYEKAVYRELSDRSFNPLETKKEIIGNSLYGVDIMPWAVHAAELRLWLQLIIETDIDAEEIQRKPLLPNLRTNLRIGDSLVQEIDNTQIDIRKRDNPKEIKNQLQKLKQERLKYYRSDEKTKLNGLAGIKKEELRIFKEIIDDEIKDLEKVLEKEEKIQTRINGQKIEDSDKDLKKQKKQAKKRIKTLEHVKTKLNKEENTPFVWDIAFAEVFEEKGGFDVVIGNPPYVRQENIAPPRMEKQNVTKEDKKRYKNKLIESVKTHFPQQVDKIGKRCDYFIYFFFNGLSILNEKGTFCFISSNAWLDVNYGKYLQEFLCKYVPIEGIYNNKAKRVFKHGDINTVISVFGAPKLEKTMFGLRAKGWPMLENEAKFITFKKPYKKVINTKTILEIDKKENYEKEIQLDNSFFTLLDTSKTRAVKITQKDLLEDGWEYPSSYNGKSFEKGRYIGNKWGCKFVRAKDIIMKLLQTEKLTRLDKFGKPQTVSWSREGKKSKVVFDREEVDEDEIEYLLLNSPRDCQKIEIFREDVSKVMKNTEILDHDPKYCPVLIESARNDRHITRKVEENIYFPHNFTGLETNYSNEILISLNSTIGWLLFENFGRTTLGQGAITFTTNDIKKSPLLVNPRLIDGSKYKNMNKIRNRKINSVFKEIGINKDKKIRNQEPDPLPDRKDFA